MSNEGKSFWAFLGGVAIGALLGILFAPAKGEETREKMADAARDWSERAKRKAEELRDTVNGKTAG